MVLHLFYGTMLLSNEIYSFIANAFVARRKTPVGIVVQPWPMWSGDGDYRSAKSLHVHRSLSLLGRCM